MTRARFIAVAGRAATVVQEGCGCMGLLAEHATA